MPAFSILCTTAQQEDEYQNRSRNSEGPQGYVAGCTFLTHSSHFNLSSLDAISNSNSRTIDAISNSNSRTITFDTGALLKIIGLLASLRAKTGKGAAGDVS